MKYNPPVGGAALAPYVTGVPGSVTGSIPPGEAIGHPQFEIVHVIEGAGLSPDEDDLYQLLEAIRIEADRANASFVDVLPVPTISTADHRLTVTPSIDVSGGKVSIAAGTKIQLGELVSDDTAVHRIKTTGAWTSASLLPASTYFLRGHIVDGVLQFYVQRGTNTDSIPVTRDGVPDAATGGGFDSTSISILIARVVTGVAGSMPVVTMYANRDRNYGEFALSPSITGPTTTNHVLQWAVVPRVAFKSLRTPGDTQDSDLDILVTPTRDTVSVVSSSWHAPSAIGTYGYVLAVGG